MPRIQARIGWRTVIIAALATNAATLSTALAADFFHQTAGPSGGPVGDLACLPDGTLFVLADGMYRSTDQANSWTKVENLPASFWGLEADQTGAVVGFRSRTLYRSTDHGATWQSSSVPVSLTRPWYGPGGLALAGTTNGLYRSIDAGQTWTITTVPLAYIGAIGQVSDGTIYVAAENELHRSIDDGLTWQLFTTLPGYLARAIAERPGGGLYVGVGDGTWGGPLDGMYSVSSSGTYSFLGLPEQSVASIVVRDDAVFVAGAGTCGTYVCFGPGLFRSDDDGATWTLVASANSPVGSLVLTPSNDLLASTGQLFTDIGNYPATGVIRASGLGTEWKLASDGIRRATVYDLASGSDGTVWAAADQTVFHSTDQGASWVAATPPPAQFLETNVSYRLAVHPSGSVLAMSYGHLSRTEDAGLTWSPLDPEVATLSAELAVSSAGTIIAFAEGGAYRSTDAGTSWSFVATGWELPWSIWEEGEMAAGSLAAVAIGSVDATHISEDDGLTWTAISARRGPLAFAPDESALYVADEDGVYRLERQGELWTETSLPASPNNIGALAVDAEGWVYAHSEGGVFRTREGDTNWTLLTGLAPSYVFMLDWHRSLELAPDGYLYAGTGDAGVYRSNTRLTMPTDVRAELQGTFGQPFPNPFRGQTSFAFTLPGPQAVDLTVFDVRGRVVAKLAEGRLLGPGRHTLGWTVSQETPSGAYFYRLGVGKNMHSGRLLLVR